MEWIRTRSLLLLTIALLPTVGTPKDNAPQAQPDVFHCGTSAARERDAIVRGMYHESSLRLRLKGTTPLSRSFSAPNDVSDVSVIEDDGTLVTEPNLFDLSNKSFRFKSSGQTSYRVEATQEPFDASGGVHVPLGDDDTSFQDLGFNFVFFGNSYTAVYLNSDGNLTFLQPDVASSARDVGRFASGPPRIGPLFADLDPSLSGTVIVRHDPDGVLFAWVEVPNYGAFLSFNNFSVKLFRDGSIEFTYGDVSSQEGIVGISPGADSGGIEAIDYSKSLPTGDLAGTIVEIFVIRSSISETAIAKRFFQTHPDTFDHLILFLDFPFNLGGNAFAYELPVKNEIEGINLGILDNSAFYGSNGKLSGFLNMGSLDGPGRYPDNPDQVFLGTNNTISIMGQESGHRWLAFTPFLDGTVASHAILGRDLAHWSFFFDSDASVMEGNDIRDNGPNLGNSRFTTVGATNTYSLLDQYLMGLVGKETVPSSFLVDNPTGTFWQPSSAPRLGVTFGGTRKEITIDSIIAANGRRIPDVLQSPKVFRQAFILLTRKGQVATPAQIQKVQNIRDAWVAFFNQKTAGRGWIVTNLQQSAGTTPSRILFPYFQGDDQRYTGIALANWGSAPADVYFNAYDNSGNKLSTPAHIINPRVVTIAPGAQVALLAEQIHGLSLSDPRNAWIEAQSSSSQVTGFFLEGDVDQTFIDGAVAGNATSKFLFFTRTRPGSGSSYDTQYQNRIVVVNPEPAADAHLSFSLFDEFGNLRDTTVRILGPRARISEDLTSLFPSAPETGSKGYIALESDIGVVGYQSLESRSEVFSLPAQIASKTDTLYSAQFASGAAAEITYFTDVNLINTSTQNRNLQINLIDNNGAPVSGIRNPVPISLAPGEQFKARGEVLFGLPDAALFPPLVEGSLVVKVDGPGIIGDVVFGDPLGEEFIAALPLDGRLFSNFVLSQVAQGISGGTKAYFTGVAMYNPNPLDVNVTLEVFSEIGQRTGTAKFVLPAGNRLSRTLPQLVPSITTQVRGYIRVTSSGGPISAFELIGGQSLEFLASVPAQPISP